MSHTGLRLLVILALSLALTACTRVMPGMVPPAERAAIAERMMRDIEILASDDFGGRKPGTIGEARTLAFLTERMQEVGLVSGTNDPGSAWRAPVELVSTLPQSSRVAFTLAKRTVELPTEAALAFTPRRRELAEGGPQTGVEVLFAGHDIMRLADLPLAGAIVILLDHRFAGQTQRTLLFERGVGAILTVVPNDAALARIREENDEERLRLVGDEANRLVAFATEEAVTKALGEERWRDLVKRTEAPDFVPVPLDIGVSIEASSRRREFVSHNLIGRIPGAMPEAGAVLLLAHWDHLGECGPPAAEDRICNGAVDNASGVALMLELARRLKAGPPLDRDIYVLATTAEEYGLLGTRAFAAAPPIPLKEIVAAFNFDNVAVAPAGSPVGIVGRGRAPFEPLIAEYLAKTRRVLGEPDFAESFLQRQDGWILLQQGVPAVLVSSAFASREALGPFMARHYHRVSDTAERIELGGAIDDMLLHEAVIRHIADTARYQPPVSAPEPELEAVP
jgi:aminopeptidase YwaD